MSGPFEDPAFIAAEAHYLTPPGEWPGSEYYDEDDGDEWFWPEEDD